MKDYATHCYAAYCGLHCGTCIHATSKREGCVGCHKGGGASYQRMCCDERELDGCWMCEDFPCSHGFFSDEAWKGLCIGCCEVIRKVGQKNYTRLVRARMGERVELGDYRNKTAQEIKVVLLGDS